MRAPASVASPSPSPVPPSPTEPLPPTTPTPPLAGRGDPIANLAPQTTAADVPVEQSADISPDDPQAALDWQAFVPSDIADHLATMDRAARESGCGVPWHLLAAIARVESDFGRNMATSSAGAVGYGQFLPSSWRSFGNEGNVYDYRDALPAIATYLCQSGLERDPRAALFAYNHADWYVDLVLDLAVRYDRMAPGAPTPDVLDVGPAARLATQMHYGPGRDVRRETARRTADDEADWLGIPWRGRAPTAASSSAALEGATMAMVRAAFGLSGERAHVSEPRAAEGLTGYADRARVMGLVGSPIEPPVLLPGPDERRLGQTAAWSLAEIRRDLGQGQPVVGLVATRLLPGHAAGDTPADQPVVLIGTTSSGLIYSDPSFSSSLGYGLELSDAEFAAAWLAASSPARALVFSARPAPAAADPEVELPEPSLQSAAEALAPPPTVIQPTPAPAEAMAPPPTAIQPTPAPAEALPVPTPGLRPVPLAAPTPEQDRPSTMVGLAAVTAATLLCALLLRSLPARRSPEP